MDGYPKVVEHEFLVVDDIEKLLCGMFPAFVFFESLLP